MERRKILLSVAILVIALCLAGVVSAATMGTAFTYQGRLADANSPAQGGYDMEFELYPGPDMPLLVASTAVDNVEVNDGYFTVQLDFGDSVFTGSELWLQIGVRPGELEDPNTYSDLSPRQELTPAPYALYAADSAADSDWTISGDDMYSAVSGNVGIGETIPAEKLDVNGNINIDSVYKIGGDTVLSNSGTKNIFVGVGAGENNAGTRNTFLGHGAGYENTGGNSNTSLGYDAGYSNINGVSNTFLGDMTGRYNTQSQNTFIGTAAGFSNSTGSNNTFIGMSAGGSNYGSDNVFLGYKAGYNEAGSDKLYIANSETNPPLIYGEFDTGNVGIGTVSPQGKLTVDGAILRDGSTMYGSNANTHINLGGSSTTGTNGQNYSYATVSGGAENTASGNYATVGGGGFNVASGVTCTVSGGENNRASASWHATVGGGIDNEASGNSATVPGGTSNEAGGDYSFAIGRKAKVRDEVASGDVDGDEGTFVWADSTNADFTSTGPDQFLIRAAGGVGIGTNSPAANAELTVNGAILRYGSTMYGSNADTHINLGTTSTTGESGQNYSYATVGGGYNNTASNQYTTVGGGQINRASNYGATVSGGAYNVANGYRSTVSGGSYNENDGSYATVPGGYDNEADGDYSFAAGRRAKVRDAAASGDFDGDEGTFVWADSTDADFTSTGPNQFLIRASGGVGIGRAPTANDLEVEGTASKTASGSWLANSDVRIKTDIETVACALETLEKVRLVSFKYTDDYRTEHPSIDERRYLNVIAQEFAEVFPDYVKSSKEKLPNGDEILQVDAYPLTVYSAAAVQELHAIVKAKDAEIAALKERLAKIEAVVGKLIKSNKGGQL